MSSSLSTADYIRYIADKYNFYVGIFNLIIGIISNIFLILIFTRMRIFRNNQCSFFLTIESFSNLGLITTMYISRIFTVILGIDPILLSIVWCKIRAFIVQGCGLYSLLTICFNTFDQYLVTNHRYAIRQLSTIKLAYRLTIFYTCFTILHSLIFLIFNDIQSSLGCTVYNSLLKKYLSFFYYPILGNAFPLIATVIFSLFAYHNVRSVVRRQIPLIRRRLDKELTSLVLARIISLVICGIPYVCNTIYGFNRNTNGNNSIESAIYSLVTAIVDCLLFTNFSVNYIIEVFISIIFL